MEYIKGIEAYSANQPTAVTIGKFDGMHRGHSILLSHITEMKKEGLVPLVLTFDTSPRIALKKQPEEVQFLFTRDERRRIMEENGIEVLLEMAFTKDMIRMEPEAFIQMLCEKLHMRYLCVGKDFRFGHKGRGDVTLLKTAQQEYGFTLEAVDKEATEDHTVISSTRIRDCITGGAIEEANRLLGYAFFLLGNITHGNRIGRTLGLPTINIRPASDKLIVPSGVYVTYTTIGNRRFASVTNVGFRPTIQEEKKELLVETHLLDFNEDVYGDTARVSFIRYIRPEKRFDSLADLKVQIEADATLARSVFASMDREKPF